MTPTAHPLPTRRSDLIIRPIGDRGRFVVKDLRSGAYFQIGEHEEFLLTRLDGRQSALVIRRGFEQQFGEPLSDADLGEFLEMAKAQELVVTPKAGDTPTTMSATTAALLGIPPPGRDQPVDDRPAPPSPSPVPAAAESAKPVPPGGPSLLYWRKALFNPDRLFDRMVPWVGFIWTRGFLTVSLLAVAAAVWVVASNWADLLNGFGGVMRWETAVLVWVVMLAATTLHEFAHGLTLKRFGGQVPELGVLVMYFLPCLFCNVSDAWLLREKWKRLLVTLAGGYCDLCVWAAAVFVWRLTPLDGLANYLAFVAMNVLGARVLFNFNPFLKLDGYYLLGDWLEVPNLLQRGQDRAKAHLRRLLWGAEKPPAEPHGRALTAYGVSSWLYGLAFLGTAVYALMRGMWGWLGPAGLAVAVGLAVVLVKSQFAGLNSGEIKAMLASRRLRTAFWVVLLVGLGWGMTLPIADRASGSFRVRGGTRFELRTPAVAVLREVLFDEGDVVPAGAIVARLEVPDLASRQTRKRAEAAEARAKLALLEAGPNPASVKELTERVERAAKWHERAKADLAREAAAHTEAAARREAVVLQAAAELKQAEATLARLESIRGRGAVSDAEYDAAVARVGVCRGLHDQAKAEQAGVRIQGVAAAETELARREKEWADASGGLALLKAGPRPEEVAALRASVARADEEVRYLDDLAGRLAVRTDRCGLITTPRLKERVGRLFPEGELVCEIEDTSALEVEVMLKEGQTARVEAGQEVEVLARALPFQTLRGSVRRVAPAARRPGDRGDGTQPAVLTPSSTANADAEGLTAVYCVLDAGESALRPGMTGHARIHRGERPAWMVLSESALRTVRVEFWK
jgi:multidrug resistance efflux pump